MCDDSRCFYHDDKELFHRVRSTWTESPNTLDWEFCVLCLFVDKVDTFIIQKDERKERFVSFLVEQDSS